MGVGTSSLSGRRTMFRGPDLQDRGSDARRAHNWTRIQEFTETGASLRENLSGKQVSPFSKREATTLGCHEGYGTQKAHLSLWSPTLRSRSERRPLPPRRILHHHHDCPLTKSDDHFRGSFGGERLYHQDQRSV